MKKVCIGLSGGIDSSFAAYLLKQQGYDVCGFTFRIGKFAAEGEKVCCSYESILQAKKICDFLGIKHIVFDFEKEFYEKIIKRFIKDYLKGLTPNPCAFCNRFIKLGLSIEKLKRMGFDYIATGHYAQIMEIDDGKFIKRGKDYNKDQSYFLSLVKKENLDYILFPLGSLKKEQIKKEAKKIKLPFDFNKKESQSVCFTPYNEYAGFIKQYIKKIDEGTIRHINGEILGKHKGIIFYTIGKRKGLGVSYKEPLYVIEIDNKNNELIVGEEHYLYKDRLLIEMVNMYEKDFVKKDDLIIQLRYGGKNTAAIKKVKKTGNNIYDIKLKEKFKGISPGQIGAIYYKNRILCSGIILKH